MTQIMGVSVDEVAKRVRWRAGADCTAPAQENGAWWAEMVGRVLEEEKGRRTIQELPTEDLADELYERGQGSWSDGFRHAQEMVGEIIDAGTLETDDGPMAILTALATWLEIDPPA